MSISWNILINFIVYEESVSTSYVLNVIISSVRRVAEEVANSESVSASTNRLSSLPYDMIDRLTF